MKPTKKRAAKKTNHPIVGKLLDLKYRINDHYKAVGDKMDTKTDKSWVMKIIEDIRGGVVISGDEMRVANKLWEKYR